MQKLPRSKTPLSASRFRKPKFETLLCLFVNASMGVRPVLLHLDAPVTVDVALPQEDLVVRPRVLHLLGPAQHPQKPIGHVATHQKRSAVKYGSCRGIPCHPKPKK